jgi:hypothetical protein
MIRVKPQIQCIKEIVMFQSYRNFITKVENFFKKKGMPVTARGISNSAPVLPLFSCICALPGVALAFSGAVAGAMTVGAGLAAVAMFMAAPVAMTMAIIALSAIAEAGCN